MGKVGLLVSCGRGCGRSEVRKIGMAEERREGERRRRESQ